MKRSNLLMTFAIGMALVSCAQDGVSNEVKAAFDKKFPNATAVKWEKENDTEWEAKFKNEGKAYSANFSTKGDWVETEYKVNRKDLPESISALIIKDFPGYKIEGIEKFEKPTSSGYDVEIEKGEEMLELVFDNSGKLIEKKSIQEENETEEDEK